MFTQIKSAMGQPTFANFFLYNFSRETFPVAESNKVAEKSLKS